MTTSCKPLPPQKLTTRTSFVVEPKDLEIEEVAVELGYENPSALAALIRSNSRLREIGLGPLSDGAAIKRSTWASTGESLFHSLAAELEIGIAFRTR